MINSSKVFLGLEFFFFFFLLMIFFPTLKSLNPILKSSKLVKLPFLFFAMAINKS